MSGHHKWADIKRKSRMRKYKLTLVYDIYAEDFDEAREIAIHRATDPEDQRARSWEIEGERGGLKDQGDG